MGSTKSMKDKLELLNKVAEHFQCGLSHYLVSVETRSDTVSGLGTYTKQHIPANTLVVIIGGLIVHEPDNMIAMPIGAKLYLHEVHELFRATINHSCSPNCRAVGFNQIHSLQPIEPETELTIDYGTISVGQGMTIIEDCTCGSRSCRQTVKTNDYLQLDNLSAFAEWSKLRATSLPS